MAQSRPGWGDNEMGQNVTPLFPLTSIRWKGRSGSTALRRGEEGTGPDSRHQHENDWKRIFAFE